MNSTVNGNPEIVQRSTFLFLLRLALDAEAYQFGRQASLHWLSVYPGDLEVRLFYAKMLAGEGKIDQAVGLLKKLVLIDPEFLEAYREMARITANKSPDEYREAVSALYLLGDEIPSSLPLAEWALPAYSLLKMGEGAKLGGEEAQSVLFRHAGLPLIAIWMHLKTLLSAVPQETATALLEYYHQQFEECVPIGLVLADLWMKQGKEEDAITLFHHCVALDIAGQTVERLWGNDHPYRSLWLSELSIPFDLPVPARVAVRFRGNWLESGTLMKDTSSETVAEQCEQDEEKKVEESSYFQRDSENKRVTHEEKVEYHTSQEREHVFQDQELQAIEQELDRVARRLKKSGISRLDGRFPLYVIFSSWKGLEQQYGTQTTKIIDLELHRLGEVIQKRTGWRFLVFYPDHSPSVKSLGMEPVSNRDPWSLKLALHDLDQALAKKGEMIGALLIVGGANIVPFHALPNPTDDYDQVIYSDNPYGTLDSNYFIPEWPVGRLPGVDITADAGLLIDSIRSLIAYHQRGGNSNGNGSSFLAFWKTFLRFIGIQKNLPNIGYSAAVWRRSSVAVFRPVGNPQHILISPPQDATSLNVDRLLKPELVYYNLHGLEDSGEWYGQRDPFETGEYVDYPVALSPALLKRNGHAPRVIFSEACYGGHILGKTEDQALTLKFLSVGTLAVIASTAISYGSVNTPLIAADLLGNYFWQELRNEKTVGEALMLAKIELAREMNRRQGYLDPEDQKTLLSFVLYGDPLVRLQAASPRRKSAFRLKKSPLIRTAGETEISGTTLAVNEQVVAQVKQMVREYLPGIESAEVKILSCTLPEELPAQKSKNGGSGPRLSEKFVVAMSKEIPYARSIHRHYAKATIDSQGKVIKLVVSR